MRNWTIGRRMAAGYAVLIVLLVATAVVAVLALRASREDYSSAVTALQERALKGTESLQALDAASVANTSYLLTGRTAAIDALNERFDIARASAVALREGSTTPAQVAGWSDVVSQLDAWNRAVQDGIELKRAGDDEGALRNYNEKVTPVRSSSRNLAVDLVAAERKRSDATAAHATDSALRSIWLVVIVAAVAAIVGIIL